MLVCNENERFTCTLALCVYKIDIRFLDLIDRDRYCTSEIERNMSSVSYVVCFAYRKYLSSIVVNNKVRILSIFIFIIFSFSNFSL